jgi:hypothetical protein
VALNTDGTVKSVNSISQVDATAALSDRFGSALASIGDIDADGVLDIAI